MEQHHAEAGRDTEIDGETNTPLEMETGPSHLQPEGPPHYNSQQQQAQHAPNNLMNQPQQYRTYAHHQPNEPPSSFATSTMLISTGAILGLTAAASWRWLNGGDFVLFPPQSTSSPNETENEGPSQRILLQEQHQHDREASESQQQQQELNQNIQSLVCAIQEQSQQQHTLIQQLVRREDANIVNQSMSLLRQQQKQTSNVSSSSSENSVVEERSTKDCSKPFLSQMTALKTQIEQLREDLADSAIPSNGSLSPSLQRAQGRLDDMMQIVESCLQPNSNTASSTTETTVATALSKSQQRGLETPTVQLPRDGEEIVGAHELEGNPPPPMKPGLEALASALQKLTNDNATELLRQGLPLLYLYVHNLEQHPQMPRYRKIFTSNESFQTKIQPLIGGLEVLQAVGFAERGSCWEWLPLPAKNNNLHEKEQGEKDNAAVDQSKLEQEHLEYLREAAYALSALKKQSSTTVSSTPPPPSSNQNKHPQDGLPGSPASIDSASLSPMRMISTTTTLATPSEGGQSTGGTRRQEGQLTQQITNPSPLAFFPQTPDPSIKSPPIPKKQIFPSYTTTPPLATAGETPPTTSETMPGPPLSPVLEGSTNLSPRILDVPDETSRNGHDKEMVEESATNAIWK